MTYKLKFTHMLLCLSILRNWYKRTIFQPQKFFLELQENVDSRTSIKKLAWIQFIHSKGYELDM